MQLTQKVIFSRISNLRTSEFYILNLLQIIYKLFDILIIQFLGFKPF